MLLKPEVSYLLGDICSRGTFHPLNDKITIGLPFKKVTLQTPSTYHDNEARLLMGLQYIQNRFKKSLGCETDIQSLKKLHTLTLYLNKGTIAWDSLYDHFETEESYHNFHVPEIFYDDTKTSDDTVREFIKGYADIAGTIRTSNNDQIGRHRVYIDIINTRHNWAMPVQLCSLLQQRLNVHVREIMYGHPNLGRKFREHQMRIDAYTFYKNIGFNFSHKQETLEECAKLNKKMGLPTPKLCPGLGGKPKKYRKKARDPDIKDTRRLPSSLVGKHFNRYAEICRKCGCIQDKKTTFNGRPKL